MMSSDPFDDLLGLEDGFYQEGYNAGITDGEHAGIVEGKLFGIEKGYEKALELGRLHGRAMTWQHRQNDGDSSRKVLETGEQSLLSKSLQSTSLPKNSRIAKHIEALLIFSDNSKLACDNSDEAVAEFEEHIARSHAKAKVVAAIIGEPLKIESGSSIQSGIEESTGLNARH